MTNDGWDSKWPPDWPPSWLSEAPRQRSEWDREATSAMDCNKPEVKQSEASTFIYTTKEKPWPITGHVVCDVDKEGNIIWPANKAMTKASGVPDDWLTHEADIFNIAHWPKASELIGLDLGTDERTTLTTFENDGIKHHVIKQEELYIGWDKGSNDKTTIAKIENHVVTKIAELKPQGSNLVDDQAYLYFQCDGCGEILDPHTKSFAKLQEHRVNSGWKCVWDLSGNGYKVYCGKCGK